jgi:hypothetical protein
VHPTFCYLARDRRISNDKVGSVYCYIGLSRHPIHRLQYNQNRVKGWKVGSKATKQVAPHWQLEMIVGPFYDGNGTRFKEAWRKGARRFKRRVKFGVHEGERQGVSIYCRDVSLIKGIIETQS